MSLSDKQLEQIAYLEAQIIDLQYRLSHCITSGDPIISYSELSNDNKRLKIRLRSVQIDNIRLSSKNKTIISDNKKLTRKIHYKRFTPIRHSRKHLTNGFFKGM